MFQRAPRQLSDNMSPTMGWNMLPNEITGVPLGGISHMLADDLSATLITASWCKPAKVLVTQMSGCSNSTGFSHAHAKCYEHTAC